MIQTPAVQASAIQDEATRNGSASYKPFSFKLSARLQVLGCVLLLSLGVIRGAFAANNYAIVGDSLSKEYSVEGPVLWQDLLPLDYSDYTKAIKARNWMEILTTQRGSEFNFGAYGTRTDSRVPAGHEHNWAVPGSTTDDWRGALNGASALQQFLLADFDSDIKNNANRVVIFLGGNDLNSNYDAYYNGADPTAFIASMLSNYAFIVQHIKTINSATQIVICTAPDVGATPRVQNSHPDPAKRALVTSLTQTLNAGIAQLAAQQGLGLADIYKFTGIYIAPETVTLGGLPLIKGTDKGNNPIYLFSEDGFHPNTSGQALCANEIIKAFNDKFQAGIAPLSDSEIVVFLESQHDVTFDLSPYPTLTIFTDAIDLGSGWQLSSWFGYYYDAGSRWIYQADQGWMYVIGTDPGNVWYWTQDMGWLWTGSTIYPFLWSDSGQTWLWYLKDSHNPRWFFNYSSGQWEKHNP